MRWIVLLATFALWLGSLAVVYFHCRPAQIDDLDATSRAALNRVFAENAVEQHAWNIYVDRSDLDTARNMFPSEGASTPQRKITKREWSGVDEKSLVLAGRTETRIKNKHLLSLDEETTLRLELPGTPVQANYAGSAHLNLESGLESCKMSLKLRCDALEFDVLSKGTREGNDLVFTTSIANGAQSLYNGSRRVNIGGNAALNAELAPFQYNPNAKPNQEWTILMMDLDPTATDETQGVKPMAVRCVGRTTILMKGAKVEAFEVRSNDGSARAWYSPDGNVLKQVFKLAGVLEIVLVRDDPEPAAETAAPAK